MEAETKQGQHTARKPRFPCRVGAQATLRRKKGRLYLYYATQSVLKHGPDMCSVKRVPAAVIEEAVIDQIRSLIRAPEMIARTASVARTLGTGITEAAVREALIDLDTLWVELFPAEQARIVQLMVDRVDVNPEGISVRMRTDGLTTLATQLGRDRTSTRDDLAA